MSEADTPSLEETLPAEDLPSVGPAGYAKTPDSRAHRPTHAFSQGDRLGRYMVLSLLGTGGMGAVYSAYDPELDRKVAIKLLRPGPGATASSAEGGAARLLREAKAMAKLTHPNVITVHDVGTLADQVFVAMEFVEGGTLSAWLKTDPPADQILRKFEAAGHGLSAAHQAGLVHRDFKPDNVLLGGGDRVVVADFGLARAVEVQPSEAVGAQSVPTAGDLGDSAGGSGSLGERMTVTGGFLGTPAYMAPEQHLQQSVDARSDQFSFCVALYEAVYQQRPFRGDTLPTLAFEVTQGNVQAPASGRAPPWLWTILARGLATRPEDRYPDMDALLADLRARPRRRRQLAAGGVTLVAMGIVGGTVWSMSTADPCQSAADVLDGVWDEARHKAVERAILDTQLPYAADVLAKVTQTLDRFATGYVAEYRDACEATHIRGDQSPHMLDLRMACLQRRKNELQQTVAVLESADPGVVRKALTMVSDLPSLDRCRDLDALQSRVAPPESPQMRTRVGELQEKIARARALKRAGKVNEARKVAAAVAKEAAGVDYLPIRAEANEVLGAIVASLDEAEAEAMLQTAAEQALTSGHDPVFVRAATTLIASLSVRQERHAEADQWMGLVEAMLDRIGDDPQLEGFYLMVKGQALREREQWTEALETMDRAIARYKQMDAPLSVGHVQAAKSAVLYDMGAIEEAQALMRETLQLISREQGHDHPETITLLGNLAVTSLQTGDAHGALHDLRDVVERRTRVFGPDHLSTVDSRSNLGLALVDVGHLEQAETHLRYVLNAYQERFPGGNTDVGECHANLADVLKKRGKIEEAREHLAAAAQLFQREDPEGWRHGVTLISLAMLGGDAPTSQELASARKGLAFAERALGPEHPRYAVLALNVADAELRFGDVSMARQRIEAMLPVISKAEDPYVIARSKVLLGEAVRIRAPDRARRLFREASQLLPAISEGPKKTSLAKRLDAAQ